MKKSALMVVLFISGMVIAQSCYGAARNWQIDQAHSGFHFTVTHIFSKVRGHFAEFSGTVNFDPANLGESSMRFVIQTKSIDTNIAKRDKHLQSPDFFDAAQFPEMVFESVSITDVGDNLYNVAGKFHVKGKIYDLMLPLTLAGIKDHPTQKGQEVAGFNATLVLDRLKYGVGSGKFVDYGVVGRDVEVLVTFEVLSKK